MDQATLNDSFSPVVSDVYLARHTAERELAVLVATVLVLAARVRTCSMCVSGQLAV